MVKIMFMEYGSMKNLVLPWGRILTHLPLVSHICVSESGQHWFRKWLVACSASAPSHYLNQCWVTVNWTLRNNLQWNCNQNIKLFIHENESVKISSVKWWTFSPGVGAGVGVGVGGLGLGVGGKGWGWGWGWGWGVSPLQEKSQNWT